MPTELINYELKSDLARLCLPAASRDADRAFAWMNSVCLFFLLIGIFGRPAAIYIAPPPPREIVPAVIVPAVPPPTTVQELKPEETAPREQPAVAQVAVTLDSPAINFSIPTIGTLVVPAALSGAPPFNPMNPPAAIPVAHISELANTGTGGDRPQPPYPRAALERQQQGSVVLSLTANAEGSFTNVTLQSSSGSRILDSSTLDFVRNHWSVPPGAGGRLFEATIRYRLILE